MPETTITALSIPKTGRDMPAALAAANEDGSQWLITDEDIVMLENASAGEITVTIHDQTNCNRGVTHDYVVAIAAGAGVSIGAIQKSYFSDGDGYAHMTFSAFADLTVMVFTRSRV